MGGRANSPLRERPPLRLPPPLTGGGRSLLDLNVYPFNGSFCHPDILRNYPDLFLYDVDLFLDHLDLYSDHVILCPQFLNLKKAHFSLNFCKYCQYVKLINK